MDPERDMLAFATKDYKPIPRFGRTVPFGYAEDPDNPHVLVPVRLELEALEKAKKHVTQFPYRAVAQWLTKTTGRYISHVGLKKRLDVERHRKGKATVLKQLANRAEEARAKAQKVLDQRTGAYALDFSDELEPTRI